MTSDLDHWLEVDKSADATIARLKTPQLWKDADIQAVAVRLSQLLGDHGCHRLIVDLGQGGELASRVLARFLFLSKQAKGVGRELALCGVDPLTREILVGMGLDRHFRICENEQEALDQT